MAIYSLRLIKTVLFLLIFNSLEAVPVGITSSPSNGSGGAQNTILDSLNNLNMNGYAEISKGFKALQEKVEDLSYGTPLGRILGPVATAANMVTGFINDKNDELVTNLYHGVRKNLGLKGTVVTPDLNLQRPQKAAGADGTNTNTTGDTNQDTVLDHLNNLNIRRFAFLSRRFKNVQDQYEDVMYAAPLGKYLGPLATGTNILTGTLNDKHDEVAYKMYLALRDWLGLNGTVVQPKFSSPKQPKRPPMTPAPPVNKELVQKRANEEMDALDALLG